MRVDDKNLTLLHDLAATLAGTELSVSLGTASEQARVPGTVAAEVHKRGGWHRPVLLYPVRGAAGLAVAERAATAARDTEIPILVVAEAIGRELREALVGRGLGYLDLAGNCHLEFDGGNVTLHVEGRRREARLAPLGGLRAAGYQVLFSLLADERLLAGTVRELGSVAHASRHAAQTLLERLRQEGLLQRTGRSHHLFAPSGREKCIDRFSEGWAGVLRDRQLVGRYRLRDPDANAARSTIERAFHAAGVRFGFGGAHGSSRWLRYLQSDEVVVHCDTFGSDLVRELGAAPDRQGPLVVFRTMTDLDLTPDFADTAHPLLIHAELARSSDPRAREAASLLLAEVLRGKG